MAFKSLALSFILLLIATSCGNSHSSGDILEEFAQEVNNNKGHEGKYKAFNNPRFLGICHYVKNTPENKAKLLMLGHDQDLTSRFKKNILKNLDKGEVLTQIVREKKGLAYAICCEDLEYHVYFPPEELYFNFYKE